MSRTARTGLFALIALGIATAGNGQDPTGTKTTAPPGADAGAAQGGRGPTIPGANDVVATVTSHNHVDKITKGEVFNFLSRNPLPAPEDREVAYQMAVDMLVNTALLNQFLARQNIPVPPDKVDEQINRIKDQLKSQKQDLPTLLLQTGTSMDELRKEFENRVRWMEYYKAKGTDATLRKYLNDNRDRFSRTQVRASHILLKTEPNASAADKEKVKQKLAGIRNEILQNKFTFAGAANKYSQDPANDGGAGGDLDYFNLDSGFIEEFAEAAFKLKKGEISEPVETPFGYHLIQVTDRREGRLPDFEQNKPYILDAYAAELQRDVIAAERKAAKIDVKPMPKDLFPAEQPATPAAAGAAAPKS
ncbi:MAG: peptidylprolyl isomerase [Isosphaeraceae bacterium]